MFDEAVTFLNSVDPGSAFDTSRTIEGNAGTHPIRYDLVREFVSIIEQDAKFADHQRWMSHFIFNGNSTSLYTLANAIIRRVIGGVSPPKAMEEALDLIQSKTVDHIYGVGVSGIRTNTPIDFEDGFKLLPREALPSGPFRQRIVGLKFDGSEDVDFKINGPAPCALIFSKKRQFIYRRGENAQHDQGELQPKFEKKIEAILAAVAVSTDGSAKPRAYSFAIDHPLLKSTPDPFVSSSADFARELGGLVVDLQPDGFAKITRLIESLPPNHYRRLCLSTEFARSSRTVNCSPLVRRAIDMGTALEVLLTPEQGSELSYRLCLRGAIAKGGSVQDRKQTFSALREFYKLRSSAVHDGKFSSKYDYQKDYEKYYERIIGIDHLFQEIATNLVMTQIIERDWLDETFNGAL